MIRAALVALLVVLAGCSVGDGQSVDTAVTPAPDPTLGRDVNRSADGTWLRDGNVIDAEALADAHLATLSGRSYRVDEHYVERRFGYHISNLRIVEDATTWVSSDGSVRHIRSRHNIPLTEPTRGWWENISVYQHEGERFVETRRNGSKSFDIVRSFSEPYVDSDELISWALNVRNASVTELERNGTTYYRIYSDDPKISALRWASNYEVTALVEKSGFVHRISVNYTFRRWGKSRRIQYVATFERIDPQAVPTWFRTPAPTTRVRNE